MAIKPKKSESASADEAEWPFGPKNYILFGIALVVIIIGFFTLSQGSITLAPILLTIGYCVLVPVAILYRDKSIESEAAEDAQPE